MNRILAPAIKSSRFVSADALGGVGGFAGKYTNVSMKRMAINPASVIKQTTNC